MSISTNMVILCISGTQRLQERDGYYVQILIVYLPPKLSLLRPHTPSYPVSNSTKMKGSTGFNHSDEVDIL